MTRYPTVPLFDDVMGHAVPTLQTGAEEQRDALAAEADRILETARLREDARPVVRIDYDRMNREGRKQKAALTRAINSGDPARVIVACRNAVRDWDEIGAWPDGWSRWQRALDEALPFGQAPRLEDLT